MGIKKEIKKVFGPEGPFVSTEKKYFRGEINAVMAGVDAHLNFEQRIHTPRLRRNVHRLEKGLCYPRQKGLFAQGFIAETIDDYLLALNNPQHDPAELAWANQVLSRYFSSVDRTDAKIASAWSKYQGASEAGAVQELELTPFEYASRGSQLAAVDFASFHQLCKQRVSCRWFEDKLVDDGLFLDAVRCASQAASACNRQPFKYLLIKNEALKKKVVNLPFGTAGFGEDLPGLAMVLGDLSNFSKPRDRHLIYIDSALASSQLMLALTAMNLASVPINWPDDESNNQAARELLGLESFHVPIMLIGFGYPLSTAKIPYSQKKAAEHLVDIYE